MKVMKYYPIIIPTLCRFDHFKRCIESLSRCSRSNEIDCYVGLDFPSKEEHKEGYKKIKHFLDSNVFNFHKLIVLERDHNLGALENMNQLLSIVREKYDSYIYTEDDNEFSPCFLDYIIKCIEQYKDNENVYSICGYSRPEYKELTDSSIIFTLGNSAYGTAYWVEKEKAYINLPKQYYKDAVSTFKSWKKLYKLHRFFVFGFSYSILHDRYFDDGKYSCYSFLENKYQIKPAISLVRNWGCDGSGLHSGNNPEVSKREISKEEFFKLEPDEPVVLNKRVLTQMVKEAGSPFSKSRIHQEIGAFVYPFIIWLSSKVHKK